MEPSNNPITLDEFLAMSTEQRKALPRETYNRLFGEAVVRGLNEHTAKLPDPPHGDPRT